MAKDNNEISRYVARAAMWQMLEQHQGNAVIDDGAWATILDGVDLDDQQAKRESAMVWLRQLEQQFLDMGIEPTDDDLVRLVAQAHREIEEAMNNGE